ncbi:nucleotide exchange factor GrpE [Candidatus Caldipriscus sp.]|nr:nucleotide exchange factor GrpE [Candidatus Caldipriscus sp.]
MRKVERLLSHSAKILELKTISELKRENLKLKLSLYNILNDYEALKKVMEVKAKQREESIKESFVKELLPLLEDIDRLLNHLSSLDLPENLKESVGVIYRKMEHTLRNLRIEKIAPLVGEDFDPEKHEALTAVSSELPKGKIAVVFEVGWKFGDKLIKPARVGVSI